MSDAPLRVLVVDDEPETARAIMRVLKTAYEVETAASGEEGVARLASFRPDIVISDLQMPGLGGQQVLEEAQRLFPDSIRLVLTGQQSEGSWLPFDPSVSAYLAKPWSNEELLSTLAQLLEERSRRRSSAG
jgi:CheY-like chemotaxis protein